MVNKPYTNVKIRNSLKQKDKDFIISKHRDYLMNSKNTLTFEQFKKQANLLKPYNRLTNSDLTLLWKKINKKTYISSDNAQIILSRKFQLQQLRELQEKLLFQIKKGFVIVYDSSKHQNTLNYIGTMRNKQEKQVKQPKQAFNTVLSRKDYYMLKSYQKSQKDFNIKLLGFKIIPKNERLIDKRDTIKNQLLRFSEKYNNNKENFKLDKIDCKYKKNCNRYSKYLTYDNKLIDYPNDCNYCLQAKQLKKDYIKRFRKSYLVSYKLINPNGKSIKDYLDNNYERYKPIKLSEKRYKRFYVIYDKPKLFSLNTLDYKQESSEIKRLLYKNHTNTKYFRDIESQIKRKLKDLETTKKRKYQLLKPYKIEFMTKKIDLITTKQTSYKILRDIMIDVYGKQTNTKLKEFRDKDFKISKYSKEFQDCKLYYNYMTKSNYREYLNNLLTMCNYKLNKLHANRIRLRKEYSKKKRVKVDLLNEFHAKVRNSYNLNLENNNDLVLKQARKRDKNAFNRVKQNTIKKLEHYKTLKPKNEIQAKNLEIIISIYEKRVKRLNAIKFHRLCIFEYERNINLLYYRELQRFYLFFHNFLLENTDIRKLNKTIYKQYKPLINITYPYDIISYIRDNKVLNAYFTRIFDNCIHNISYVAKETTKKE